jgi:hypothetical protein
VRTGENITSLCRLVSEFTKVVKSFMTAFAHPAASRGVVLDNTEVTGAPSVKKESSDMSRTLPRGFMCDILPNSCKNSIATLSGAGEAVSTLWMTLMALTSKVELWVLRCVASPKKTFEDRHRAQLEFVLGQIFCDRSCDLFLAHVTV